MGKCGSSKNPRDRCIDCNGFIVLKIGLKNVLLMKILLVQESDWLERNPHQQHHLMERLSLRGHEIVVIDYDINWRKESEKKLWSKRLVFEDVHKIHNEAKVKVVRPFSLKIPVLEYLFL